MSKQIYILLRSHHNFGAINCKKNEGRKHIHKNTLNYSDRIHKDMCCHILNSALTLNFSGFFFSYLHTDHCALQHSASWHGYMYQCLSIKQINRTIEIKDAFPKRAKWKKEAWTLKSGNS